MKAIATRCSLCRSSDRQVGPLTEGPEQVSLCGGCVEVFRQTLEDGSVLVLHRLTAYPDRFRAYGIVVDGTLVGEIRARESVVVPVSPGRHTVILKIDWCTSNLLELEVEPGAQLRLECGSALTGWRMLLAPYYMQRRRNEYLWLRHVS